MSHLTTKKRKNWGRTQELITSRLTWCWQKIPWTSSSAQNLGLPQLWVLQSCSDSSALFLNPPAAWRTTLHAFVGYGHLLSTQSRLLRANTKLPDTQLYTRTFQMPPESYQLNHPHPSILHNNAPPKRPPKIARQSCLMTKTPADF